jgi:hypothetical protein
MMLGGIAGDPGTAPNRVLEAIRERHGDVVSLIRSDHGLRWAWVAQGWPGVER